MKKVLRYIALSLTVVLLAVTLCGCNALDEMRASHALLGEDGSITLNGKTYKPLPPCDTFLPSVNITVPMVNVTEADVPLLLSDMLAVEYLAKCDDTAFLCHLDTDTYYCRADRYDEVAEKINKGPVFTVYAYEYTYWDDELYEYVENVQPFSAAEAAAMDAVFATVKPVAMETLSYVAAFEELMEIYHFSADMLFKTDLCTLVRMENRYFLSMTVDNDTTAVYRIPDAQSIVFDGLVNKYLEVAGYEDDFEGI